MKYYPAKIQTKKKSCPNQDRKAAWTKGIVVWLLVSTAAIDFLTFYVEEKFRIFDMSLLTILTDNILIIFAVKFAVIFGLVYLLVWVKKAGDYSKYLWLMMAVYLILFQTVGAISNRQVAEDNPPVEDAPSVEVRVKTGINFSLIWGYFPIGFAMLSFWLWNWGWRDE